MKAATSDWSEEYKSINPCKKSPSQLKRDEERKQKFIESKSKAEAPTTGFKAGESKPKEKAEENIIEGTEKALKVTEDEKDVTSF